MTDRVSSDHDSVETHRAPVETVGRTDRVRVLVPDAVPEADLAVDDVVECFLDGEAGYARIDATLEGDRVLRRVAANRRQAREGDGDDRLAAWAADADVRVGGTVHFDVVTPGHAYGLRTPGTRAVYRVTEPPSKGLADIAADVEDA